VGVRGPGGERVPAGGDPGVLAPATRRGTAPGALPAGHAGRWALRWNEPNVRRTRCGSRAWVPGVGVVGTAARGHNRILAYPPARRLFGLEIGIMVRSG
jgi:hypothetical protein